MRIWRKDETNYKDRHVYYDDNSGRILAIIAQFEDDFFEVDFLDNDPAKCFVSLPKAKAYVERNT